ncbi:MAG TPA: ABC-F family ATP-binding cassette domain-containing protein [Euzebyales bacterium]|nr:ABC-F family ATP-binding cassette domain-containing protein [Euzebyales bacterium]
MLAANRLTRAHGSHVVLRDLDLQVIPGMRVGVIGANGSGKTTLLELLAGDEAPDAGTVTRAGGVTVGHARQDVTVIRDRRVLDAVLDAAADVVEGERDLRDLEHRIAASADDEREVLLRRYGTLQDRFAIAAGYSVEARARKVLAGLGFEDDAMSADIATLSGGWMMRVALARLLLRTPDVLLLDEPTNHLDFAAADWLAGYVAGYRGAVVAVSHDRWFLDEIATHILELDGAGGWRFRSGMYSIWVEERDAERSRIEAAAATQARQIAQTEAFIERFRAKATKARQVQSRVKALEKLERVEVRRPTGLRVKLSLPTPPRSGRDVVVLDGVRKAYSDTTVFDGLDLVVERGRTIAVLGPNGAGKSTLLRIVAGVEDPDGGTCRLGHNVTAAYVAQHHADALDLDRTVLAELDSVLHDRATNPRSVLGAFGFPGDAVEKRVGQCSGGERARLALAKLVVGPANLLCLDEPTNHLDLASRELLTSALDAYAGTVLLVTHDRALIREVADGICAVGGGTAALSEDDLDAHLAGQRDDGADDTTVAPSASERRPVDRRQQRRDAAEQRRRTQGLRDELARAEAELEQVEQRLAELEAALSDPTTYEDPEAGRELTMEHAVVSDRVAGAERRWENLVVQVDDAS